MFIHSNIYGLLCKSFLLLLGDVSAIVIRFQATLMHLTGIDHERLTYKFQGRRFRLTDVDGKIVKKY